MFKRLCTAAALVGLIPWLAVSQYVPSGSLARQALPAQAPFNPAFLRYLKTANAGDRPRATATHGHRLGWVPQSVSLSHLSRQPLNLPALQIPASYDLRALGRMTPVKDQGDCNACWAFATFASTESILQPDEARDFSEDNLKNLSGYDMAPCDGGNAFMSMAYLGRWAGPIEASDDPYQDTNNTSPQGLMAQKHTQDALILGGRNGPLDNDALKIVLMTYGAIQTAMYMDESTYYNPSTSSYYYDGSASAGDGESAANHSVTLAGWDDNYSRSNFPTTPPGDGAFLVKNSWGTDWGDGGYFWISYYDAVIASASYAFTNNQPVINYTRKYGWDPLGLTSTRGYPDGAAPNTAWFANIFAAAGDEQLVAASFYTLSNRARYTISIYTNVNSGPTTGVLAGTTTATEPVAGYHTIALTTPVSLTRGMSFAVVVRITTPGYTYPIPVENAIAGYSSGASANPGQSYISSDGVAWTDLTAIDPSANVCLKAFTIATSAAALSITASHSGNSTAGQAVTYTVTVANQAQTGSTAGAVTVTDSVPAGLSLASMGGSGWSCFANACSRNDPLSAGASFPPISVVMNVASNATAGFLNEVEVLGGGSNAASATDSAGSSPFPSLGSSSSFEILNGASFLNGPVAPNEMVAILGSNLGPPTAERLQSSSGKPVATTLGGVSVMFDGVPAEVLYVSATQVDAVVPASVVDRVQTQVIVTSNGVSSAPALANVAATAPGLFTVNGSGTGPAAIRNADGTSNSIENPAARGSEIVLYATGEGAVLSPLTLARIPLISHPIPPLSSPVAAVSVTFGQGSSAIQVPAISAVEAPGGVPGLLQIHVAAPENAGHGVQPISVTMGSATNSGQSATVYLN